MPSWKEILEGMEIAETTKAGSGFPFLINCMQDNLKSASTLTDRNIILYFSSFLHKPSYSDTTINDKDINAFMEAVYKMDKTKGLDIILHTPGGDIAATEQIIYYLHSYFNNDIRAIVPQMAMSAGSIIAVSCKSIVMGRQSCLGPFDPQINNMPSQSVVREFYKAVEDVKKNPASLGLWQAILSKLNPTFLTICDQANKLSDELTDTILKNSDYNDETKDRIKEVFGDSNSSKTHSRHINRGRCREIGLHIEDLELNQVFQDTILTIHHCCMILSEKTPLLKLVENQIGGSYMLQAPPQPQPVHMTRQR